MFDQRCLLWDWRLTVHRRHRFRKRSYPRGFLVLGKIRAALPRLQLAELQQLA